MTLFHVAMICQVALIVIMFYVGWLVIFNSKAIEFLRRIALQLENEDIPVKDFNTLIHADIPQATRTWEASKMAVRVVGVAFLLGVMFSIIAYFNLNTQTENFITAVVFAGVVVLVADMRRRSRYVEDTCHDWDMVITSLEFEKEHLSKDPETDVE